MSVTTPPGPYALGRGGQGPFLSARSDGSSVLLGWEHGGPGVDGGGPKVAALPALGCLSAAGAPAAQSMSEHIDIDPLRYMRRP